MNKKSVFQIQKLNVWYSNMKKHVLKNVSVNIPQNQVTALIGPSGCGKSTFIRCFNKMNDLIVGIKIGGSIKFKDKYELVDEYQNFWQKLIFYFQKQKNNNSITPMELRTRIGMVFQKPNPFPMSIYDNVAYGPRSSGIRKKQELDTIVKKSLEDAALWDEVKDALLDSALSLSGGQQQRLCIARTIAMEPEVLLMDEPTSSLDPIATSKIEKLIYKLKRKYTIIIVTHSMQQAARISDNTLFFYLGKLIEFNKTKKIFTAPSQKLTSNYIRGKIG